MFSLSPKIRRSHDKKSVLMIFNTMSFDTGGPGSLRALSICTSQESVWVQTVYGCKKKKENWEIYNWISIYSQTVVFTVILQHLFTVTAFSHNLQIFNTT